MCFVQDQILIDFLPSKRSRAHMIDECNDFMSPTSYRDAISTKKRLHSSITSTDNDYCGRNSKVPKIIDVNFDRHASNSQSAINSSYWGQENVQRIVVRSLPITRPNIPVEFLDTYETESHAKFYHSTLRTYETHEDMSIAPSEEYHVYNHGNMKLTPSQLSRQSSASTTVPCSVSSASFMTMNQNSSSMNRNTQIHNSNIDYYLKQEQTLVQHNFFSEMPQVDSNYDCHLVTNSTAVLMDNNTFISRIFRQSAVDEDFAPLTY